MKKSLFVHSCSGALAATLLLCAIGTPVAAAATPEFAIRNAQRPGAAAAPCPDTGETPDGCTFHARTGVLNRARLPAAPGAVWIASTPDPSLVTIRAAASAADTRETGYQVIDIVPTRPEDADITITFDKLTGPDGARRLVERRRVSVMKHSEKTWHEH